MKDVNGGTKPCLLLLQAYFSLLRGNHFNTNRLVSSSISTAKEMKMGYMASWAEACQKAWASPNEPSIEWQKQALNDMTRAERTGQKHLEMTFYILPIANWLKE